jgi:hypothetical protein
MPANGGGFNWSLQHIPDWLKTLKRSVAPAARKILRMTHGQCRKRWPVARIALDRLTQQSDSLGFGFACPCTPLWVGARCLECRVGRGAGSRDGEEFRDRNSIDLGLNPDHAATARYSATRLQGPTLRTNR